MKKLLVILALSVPLPALAQDAPNTEVEEGLTLLERGAQMLFQGMMSEMEPTLQDMADAFAEAEPMLRDMLAMMDDLTNYHPPEIMPNGDIILRRKTPAEMAPVPDGEIEL
ncbi:MAG: AAA+ family ATPase [Rhodobacteraceae bacterium]|jgi:hypothetical protein|nr:AAA+ family ATPase [Paracoccaceae bacterium]